MFEGAASTESAQKESATGLASSACAFWVRDSCVIRVPGLRIHNFTFTEKNLSARDGLRGV